MRQREKKSEMRELIDNSRWRVEQTDEEAEGRVCSMTVSVLSVLFWPSMSLQSRIMFVKVVQSQRMRDGAPLLLHWRICNGWMARGEWRASGSTLSTGVW